MSAELTDLNAKMNWLLFDSGLIKCEEGAFVFPDGEVWFDDVDDDEIDEGDQFWRAFMHGMAVGIESTTRTAYDHSVIEEVLQEPPTRRLAWDVFLTWLSGEGSR